MVTTMKEKEPARHSRLAEHEQVAARLTPEEIRSIDRMVSTGFFLNRSDFVRSAVREKIAGMRIVAIRDVPRKQVESEIIEYLRTHPVSYPSDIALKLRLDLATVMEVTQELLARGDVKEEYGHAQEHR